MWIEELFVDEFDAAHDLSLLSLARGLNIVPMQGLDEAHRLRSFVPDLVFGKSLNEATDCHGAVVLRPLTDPPSDSRIELCRLRSSDATTSADLRVIESRPGMGEVETTLTRQDVFADWSADEFNAFFTDRLTPQDRLTIWRKSSWFASLFDIGEGRRTNASADDTAVSVPPAVRGENQRRAAARRRSLKRALKRAASRSAAQASNSSEPAGPHATAPHARNDYFSAKARERALRDQIQTARNDLQAAERHWSLLKQGHRLAGKWQAVKELERKIDAVPPCDATTVDVDSLRELDERITETRGRLQELRKHDASRPVDDSDSTPERTLSLAHYNLDHDTLQASVETIDELLGEWPQCREQLTQLRELQSNIAVDRRSSAPDEAQLDGEAIWLGKETPWWPTDRFTSDEARHVVAQLRSFRQQQRGVDRAMTSESTGDDQGQLKHPSDLAARAAELRQEIDEAKSQTRELLDRQLLSAEALLGIGILFSLGVAVVLAATLLNLGTANFATGAVGMTCLIGAGLLKSSLERPPADRLRQQRLRIEKLMDEYHQLHEIREQPGPEGAQVASDDFDEATYQAFLDQHGIPIVLSPRQAVAWVKQRIEDRNEQSWTPDHGNSELDSSEAWQATANILRQWFQRSEQVLRRMDVELEGSYPDDVPSQVGFLSELLRDVKHELQRQRKRAEVALTEHAKRHELIVQQQQRLRELKIERRKLLRRVGAENLAALESQVEQRRETELLELQREQWRDELEQLIAQEDDAETIRQWLAEGSDLGEQLVQQRLLIEQNKRQLAEYQQELQQLRCQIDTLAESRHDSNETALDMVDSDVSSTMLQRERMTQAVTLAIIRQLLEHDHEPEPNEINVAGSPVLKETQQTKSANQSAQTTPTVPFVRAATTWLHRLTGNSRLTIAWTAPDCPIRIGKTSHGESNAVRYRDFDALSAYQQDQVILALQFSLWQHLAASEQCLPVLLSDPRGEVDRAIALTTSPECPNGSATQSVPRSHQRLLQAIAQVAEQIPQIIWFASDDAGVDFLSSVEGVTFRKSKPSRQVRGHEPNMVAQPAEALQVPSDVSTLPANDQVPHEVAASNAKALNATSEPKASPDAVTSTPNVEITPVDYWRIDPPSRASHISATASKTAEPLNPYAKFLERPTPSSPIAGLWHPGPVADKPRKPEAKNVPIEISWDRTGPVT